jgi:ATP-binding cassette subfamily B protein
MDNSFTSLTRFIYHFSQRYKGPISGLVIIGLLWAAHASLSPITIKLIIDAVSEHSENLAAHVMVPLLGYLGLELFLLSLTSAYDYCILKSFPKLRSDVVEEMHAYLQGHSYQFFQNTMAGTLSNKIADLSSGVISILRSLIDDFFSRALLFIFGLITLFWVHPYFACALVVWSIFFFVFSLLLTKKSEKYSIDYTEARSTLMGNVVDVLSNIFTVKIFANQDFEKQRLTRFTTDMVRKESRMHWYMLKLKAGQNSSIIVLLMVMTALLLYLRQR